MVKPPIAKRLMGASLGTGVAIALEVTHEVAALVLEAPQRLRKKNCSDRTLRCLDRRKMMDIRRNFRLWPELTQIQEGWKSPRKTRRIR
jgi:hypothetical protein